MDKKRDIQTALLEYKTDLIDLETAIENIENMGVLESKISAQINMSAEFYSDINKSKSHKKTVYKQILERMLDELSPEEYIYLTNKLIDITKVNMPYNGVNLICEFK